MLSLNLEAESYYFFLFPGCDEINNIQIHFKDVSQKKKSAWQLCLIDFFYD